VRYLGVMVDVDGDGALTFQELIQAIQDCQAVGDTIASARSGGGGGGGHGRGLHSSTVQLNVSRFCDKIHPRHPLVTPCHLLNTP